jgi:HTH-type transcriptional regulator / antitoxin HigA
MIVKSTVPKPSNTYFKLVKQFPLVHISDAVHLQKAQGMIDRLLQENLDQGGLEYLEALSDLVETFEDENEPIPDASEADVLRELMRSSGLSQSKLAKQVGISQSTLSAVLSGARSLTKTQLIKLAQHFSVSPAAFLPR